MTFFPLDPLLIPTNPTEFDLWCSMYCHVVFSKRVPSTSTIICSTNNVKVMHWLSCIFLHGQQWQGVLQFQYQLIFYLAWDISRQLGNISKNWLFIIFPWIPMLKPQQSSSIGPKSLTESTMTADGGNGIHREPWFIRNLCVWSQVLDLLSSRISFLPGERVSMAFKMPNYWCVDAWGVTRGNNWAFGDHPPTHSPSKMHIQLLGWSPLVIRHARAR